jgi:excisionase family DNA binding protein
MPGQREHLEQAFEGLRQALEVAESALVEYEEAQAGEASVRPESRKGLDLLSIPELCQELGMGKSWVYQRLRSGEIPSLKLGKVIKIRREDLEEYLKHQRYHYTPAGEVED